MGLTVENEDKFPFLLTRASPNPEISSGFNSWQESKHLPDLMAGTSGMRCAFGLSVKDGLPAVYRGTAGCLAYYVAPNVTQLIEWTNGPIVRNAIEDGSRWFGGFSVLDSEPYTGNVYEVLSAVTVENSVGLERCTWLVQRFEVIADALDDFDHWAISAHLPELGSLDGVRRTRLVASVRDGIQIDYYLSLGNRAVISELHPDSDIGTLTSSAALESMRDSQRWDLTCGYAMREVYRHLSNAQSSLPRK